MKQLFTPLFLLGLLVSLFSCQDHRGFPPQNSQRARIHREYSRLVNASDPTYTSYTEFIYDASGRMISADNYVRQNGSTFTKSSSTTLTYDAQGRLEKETGSWNFYYDAMSRINKLEGDPSPSGQSVMLLTYDTQNRINGRTFTGYKADGSILSNSIETYEFDERNNVILWAQTYTSSGMSFRRRVEYTYDQGPNPLYLVPITIYRSIPLFNSPNNVIKEVVKETDSMTGPFEPLTRNETLNFVKTYQNGQLFESTDNTLARQYKYENY